MDSSGDLVAAGYTANDDASVLNFLVVKLSGADGSMLWEYAPSTTSGGVFHSVDLDDRNHVYVGGREGAPNIQGKVGTTAVLFKLDGESGVVSIFSLSLPTSRQMCSKSWGALVIGPT